MTDTPDTEPAPTGPRRLAMLRAIVGFAAGVVAAVIALAAGTSWSVAALLFWDVAAVVIVAWVYLTISGADAEETARIARIEDESRAAAEGTLLCAGAASLIAVVFTLAEAGRAHAPARDWLTALALASVAIAWASVHTVFLLRYARTFYSPPTGGIDFTDGPPDYRDFAYLALTIGMTYQVSDTDLQSKRLRRLTLHHALLAYVYGTVIIAITVSTAAGLLGQ